MQYKALVAGKGASARVALTRERRIEDTIVWPHQFLIVTEPTSQLLYRCYEDNQLQYFLQQLLKEITIWRYEQAKGQVFVYGHYSFPL